jgi:hypothetical protein
MNARGHATYVATEACCHMMSLEIGTLSLKCPEAVTCYRDLVLKALL